VSERASKAHENKPITIRGACLKNLQFMSCERYRVLALFGTDLIFMFVT